jgi:molecular chaperone GrpE
VNQKHATRIPIIVHSRATPSDKATELEPQAWPVADEHNTPDESQAQAREASEYRDKYLRAAAEMENYKKRVERRYADEAQAERRRLLRAFLAVADNLERALAHADADGALAEGVRLTYQDLQSLLSQEGVEPLVAVGHPFDPQVHEAVAVVPGNGGQAVVVDETQKGYLYRGELLRPAQVIVSKSD